MHFKKNLSSPPFVPRPSQYLVAWRGVDILLVICISQAVLLNTDSAQSLETRLSLAVTILALCKMWSVRFTDYRVIHLNESQTVRGL